SKGVDQEKISEITPEPGVVDISYRYEIEFGGSEMEEETSEVVSSVGGSYDMNEYSIDEEFDNSLDPFFDPFFMENQEIEETEEVPESIETVAIEVIETPEITQNEKTI